MAEKAMDEQKRVNLNKDSQADAAPESPSTQNHEVPQHGGTENVEFNLNMSYVPDENSEKTIAVFSVICGTASLLTACIPIIPFVFGVVGLVLAIIQLKERKSGHDLAKIGMVLSIIGIVLPVILTVIGCLIPTALYTIQNSQ